jgi:hypothetical protein
MGRNKTIRTELLSKSSINNGSSAAKQISKLLDSDNIKIISELVRQPDISSLALAKKLDIPLSTLQRR